ncbi:hypothetical protein SAMN05518672_102234 [Chitinophaga sp. CF118]|uniref:DUF5723 family protein n=1 Tax=Chitinophaga sp. CF118 TaxID=1884367 RepID=UPI0008E280C9|nr:DUF5723 family protein [Chitinophaga sp. CF118]SFD50915.1 hypothetical protein SAMN05518672_102234 [Chitinophaga sp. CF118]
MLFREMLLRTTGCLCIITMSLLLTNKAQAQLPFGGYSNSNYAGIHGVPSNPASAAATHYKWDVNIGGVNAYIGNTYVRAPRSVILHPPDSASQLKRNRDYFLDTAATGKQFAWGNVDVMMPSVLYSIDEFRSIAFTWRVRANANGGNVTTDVANFFGLDFPNPNLVGKNYDMELANGSFHWWNEFGFTYASVIKDDGEHRLKGGVTLKLLSGIAAGYAQVEGASFVMRSRTDADITRGTLKAAYSEGINNWEKPTMSNYKMFGNLGFGMDLGFVYEWREEMDGLQGYDNDQWNPEADDYKMRLGISITDLGGITYKKNPNSKDLDLRTTGIDPRDIEKNKGEGWQQYYRRVSNYFTPIASSDKFTMNTPAALNIMFDYNVDGRIFVNAKSVMALTSGKSDPSKTYAMTQLQVTPRIDGQHFGAYLPLEINAHGQFDAGVGFRAGPLVIGSSTLLSNLFQKNKNRMDGFIALRIVPINFGKTKLGCPAAQF